MIHPNDPRYAPEPPEVQNPLIDQYKELFTKVLADLEKLKQKEINLDASDTKELDAGLEIINNTLHFYL